MKTQYHSTQFHLSTWPAVMMTLILNFGPSPQVFAKSSGGGQGAAAQEFNFVFRLPSPLNSRGVSNDVTFNFKTQAASYEDAYKKAAQNCFDHFKGGRHLSEDEGLLIIDTCANPRGS